MLSAGQDLKGVGKTTQNTVKRAAVDNRPVKPSKDDGGSVDSFMFVNDWLSTDEGPVRGPSILREYTDCSLEAYLKNDALPVEDRLVYLESLGDDLDKETKLTLVDLQEDTSVDPVVRETISYKLDGIRARAIRKLGPNISSKKLIALLKAHTDDPVCSELNDAITARLMSDSAQLSVKTLNNLTKIVGTPSLNVDVRMKALKTLSGKLIHYKRGFNYRAYKSAVTDLLKSEDVAGADKGKIAKEMFYTLNQIQLSKSGDKFSEAEINKIKASNEQYLGKEVVAFVDVRTGRGAIILTKKREKTSAERREELYATKPRSRPKYVDEHRPLRIPQPLEGFKRPR